MWVWVSVGIKQKRTIGKRKGTNQHGNDPLVDREGARARETSCELNQQKLAYDRERHDSEENRVGEESRKHVQF